MKPQSRMKQAGAFAVAMLAFLGVWEGTKYVAYRDIVGVPTICTGETSGVKMGDTATPEECEARLRESVLKHEAGLLKCLTRQVPEGLHFSLLELTYNVGVSAVCRSTAVRLANAGDYSGACKAATRYVFAGGKEVKGLVNRRQAAFAICMKGVPS